MSVINSIESELCGEKRKLEEHCYSIFNPSACIMIEMDNEQDAGRSLEAQADTR